MASIFLAVDQRAFLGVPELMRLVNVKSTSVLEVGTPRDHRSNGNNENEPQAR